MVFSSWQALIHMNGHGVYVWSVYTIALVILVWNIWRPVSLKYDAKYKIKRWRQMQLKLSLQNRVIHGQEAVMKIGGQRLEARKPFIPPEKNTKQDVCL